MRVSGVVFVKVEWRGSRQNQTCQVRRPRPLEESTLLEIKVTFVVTLETHLCCFKSTKKQKPGSNLNQLNLLSWTQNPEKCLYFRFFLEPVKNLWNISRHHASFFFINSDRILMKINFNELKKKKFWANRSGVLNGTVLVQKAPLGCNWFWVEPQNFSIVAPLR